MAKKKIVSRAADAAGWLDSNVALWKDALAGRIGARWTIESEQQPPGQPKVWSV